MCVSREIFGQKQSLMIVINYWQPSITSFQITRHNVTQFFPTKAKAYKVAADQFYDKFIMFRTQNVQLVMALRIAFHRSHKLEQGILLKANH